MPRLVVLSETDWLFVKNLVCDMGNELRVNSRKKAGDKEFHDNHVAHRYNRILDCFADARVITGEDLDGIPWTLQ